MTIYCNINYSYENYLAILHKNNQKKRHPDYCQDALAIVRTYVLNDFLGRDFVLYPLCMIAFVYAADDVLNVRFFQRDVLYFIRL